MVKVRPDLELLVIVGPLTPLLFDESARGWRGYSVYDFNKLQSRGTLFNQNNFKQFPVIRK